MDPTAASNKKPAKIVAEQIKTLETETKVDRNDMLLDWSSGYPIPTPNPSMTKELFSEIKNRVAGQMYAPYTCPITKVDTFDPTLAGLTVMEAMFVLLTRMGLSGDKSAIQEVMDRIEGKPKQSVESVSVSMSYTDHLKMLQDQEQQTTPPIDITPSQYKAAEYVPTVPDIDVSDL
jgi:hypothetical protein